MPVRPAAYQYVCTRYLRGAVLALAALILSPLHAAQIRDDRGRMIDLPAPPVRIIALSPHLAELVFAAGAGPQLAAVVSYSDYPQATATLPTVGDAARIDLERVITLKPDLILGWQSGNPAAEVERLERRGFALFVTEPRTLADIPRILRAIGVLAGTNAAAEAAAARVERELATLRARYMKREPVRVFYEIWHYPLLTINGEHLINDVITLCGGVNVFATAPVLTPSVSLEAVLAARPQVVLGGSSASTAHELKAQWQRTRVQALRDLPVLHVPPDLIQRQTPRVVEGARQVCEHLELVRRELGKR